MKSVSYEQKYEKQVIALWNRAMTEDGITKERFRNQVVLDENFDPNLCLLAVEKGSVYGFVLAVKRKFPYLERGLEPEKGWISILFTEPSRQRQGIGSLLLQEAEARLKRLGAKTIVLAAYSPGYFFRGVDREHYQGAAAFFEKHGYRETEACYSMCKDLHSYQMSEKAREKKGELEEKGYRFVSFDFAYALELLEFARKEFGGGWKRNCLLSMQRGIAEECILLVLDKGNEIAGFCCRMIDGNPMRFGPIGIREADRNEGIGGVLLEVAQEEMKKRGVYHMFFLSTDDAGRRYYERHGIHVYRTCMGYEKNL